MLPDSENPIPWMPAARVLCVEQMKVYVREYPDVAGRRQVSEGISADGKYVPPGCLDINARIGFWARGPLLILYLGTDATIIDALRAATDEYLTPEARPRGPFGDPFNEASARRSLRC